MQEVIGFDYQGSFSGSCAQRALVHALLLLGISVSEREAHKATDIPPWLAAWHGTDESHLKKGIRRAHCAPVECSTDEEPAMRAFIERSLRRGMPVIISTDYGGHWAVLAGKHSADELFWIDSGDDELYGAWKWRGIAEWMYDDHEEEYYCIAVKPKNESQLFHSLVPRFEKVYELFDDVDLAEWWGYYLEDLNEIFDNPPEGTPALSSDDFFDAYGTEITDAALHYCLFAEREKTEWEMKNYRTVASMHALSISDERVPQALIKLTSALTALVCTER